MAKKKRKNIEDQDNLDVVVEEVTGTGSGSAGESSDNLVDNSSVKFLIGLFAGLLVVLGGYMLYKNVYIANKEKAAKSAIYKAEAQFKQDSFALALQNPGGGFEGFLDIIDNYGGTPSANLAKYYTGISYLNLGKYDAAIEYLKEFDAGGQVLPITKYGTLGDAYSELQDFDQAESYYNKAVNQESNDLLTPYYLRKLALLYEKNGDSASAQEIYQRIVNDYPDSDERNLVIGLINS